MKLNDKSAPIQKEKAPGKKRHNPQVIEEAIRSFLSENHECKDYKPISEYLQKQGIELTQPTISRYLTKRLKAVKDPVTGYWSLEKITAYERNLLGLEKLFEETRDVLPKFHADLKIAVLETKPHFNNVIAKKIKDTFVDDVVAAFCPSDSYAIILYRSQQNSSDDDTGVEKALSGLCEKITARK